MILFRFLFQRTRRLACGWRAGGRSGCRRRQIHFPRVIKLVQKILPVLLDVPLRKLELRWQSQRAVTWFQQSGRKFRRSGAPWRRAMRVLCFSWQISPVVPVNRVKFSLRLTVPRLKFRFQNRLEFPARRLSTLLLIRFK